MKKIVCAFVIAFISQFAISQVVINELDCDNPGLDEYEFIELKSSTPNFSLDGYILVFFNGSSSGADSSYFTVDLNGSVTDENGLLLIGSATVTPFPQLLIAANVIQNGADAVAIYQADISDFPGGTLATTTNLIDALVYGTGDADDTGLLALLGETTQINEGSGNNANSIQLNNDGVTYTVTTPTPRQLNDGSGIVYNAISISTAQEFYNEGDTFDITFTSQVNVTEDATFGFTLVNGGFDAADFTGNTTVTIPNGQNTVTTSITIVDDLMDEGDEEPLIKFTSLSSPYIPFNNFITLRAVDNDFVVASYGVPTNPTYGIVESTQPDGYYDSLNGLSGTDLRQAMQDIVANPAIVRTQTYSDIIDILKEADVNPANSNQVWLVYTEQGRAKLDYQTTSDNTGKWNREHTFPRSRGGFNDRDGDEFADGVDVFWTTTADSLRHANSDAHALRAADGPENSIRNNQYYGDGEYTGPIGNLGSFKGDVARSVLFLDVRYNGLDVVNGYPEIVGQFGDLETLLDWHRNDPPDDFEMNRNNTVYTWQFNRNPFIDHPDLVEYLWGFNVGDEWDDSLTVDEFEADDIRIYPNPATNKLFVSGINDDFEITIFSSEGRTLQTKAFNKDASLDLNLASGLYLVKIKSKGRILTRKIIVK